MILTISARALSMSSTGTQYSAVLRLKEEKKRNQKINEFIVKFLSGNAFELYTYFENVS